MPITPKKSEYVEFDKHKDACLKIVHLINVASTRPKGVWTIEEASALAQEMGDIAINSFRKEN